MHRASESRMATASAETEPFAYPQVQHVFPAAESARGNTGNSQGEADFELIWANLQHSTGRAKYTEDDFQARVQMADKQAREQGAREVEARIRADFETNLLNERKKIAQALEDFERERKTYFERVEGEVVQLALGIARKILHREAQMDPLFLAGVVRVALEKVAAGSTVKLRVPENELFRWRQVLATLKGIQNQPELVGDPSLLSGRCIMQTEVGNTNISLENQFQEIERGLLDLLALRPAS